MSGQSFTPQEPKTTASTNHQPRDQPINANEHEHKQDEDTDAVRAPNTACCIDERNGPDKLRRGKGTTVSFWAPRTFILKTHYSF